MFRQEASVTKISCFTFMETDMCYEKWVLLWKVESLTKSGLLYKNLCMLLKVTCFITLYKMILAMKSDMCLGYASDCEQTFSIGTTVSNDSCLFNMLSIC